MPSLAVRTQAHAQPTRVLVVDDVALNTELVKFVLEREGYEVAAAGGGRAALELAARERFHLVLMDLQMPGMDGFATLDALRALPGAAGSPPVAALTALTAPEVVRRCREVGMAGHIAKPVTPDDLLTRVRDLLDPEPLDPAPEPEPFETRMSGLRARFLAELAGQAAQLGAVCADAEQDGWNGDRRLGAANLCHFLAGSGGMFGEPDLAAIAREGERVSLDPCGDPLPALRALETAIAAAARPCGQA